MAITFPNRKDIINSILSDIQGEMPQLNPSLRNQFCLAFAVGLGGRIYESNLMIQQLLKQMFPDTAKGEFLKRWGYYVGISQKSATASQGNIVVTGTSGTVITAGTKFISPSNTLYTCENFDGVTYPITVGTQTKTANTLTSAANIATMTFLTKHPFASGQTVTIAGAVPIGYNGSFVITADDDFTITYELASSLSSPATGTITASAVMASLPITSAPASGTDQTYGLATNLDSGAELTIVQPLTGLNPLALVTFDGISGGADEENEADLYARILYRYQHPVTPFNKANITAQAQTVPGVTRVWVLGPDDTVGAYAVESLTSTGIFAVVVMEAPHGLASGDSISISGAVPSAYNVTSTPCLVINATTFAYIFSGSSTSPATGTIQASYPACLPGQVKVLFTLDNDPVSIIPDASVVEDVLNALLKIKPAHMAKKDMIVLAPNPLAINFTFSSIVPNTVTMKSAVAASLNEFFRSGTQLGEPLLAVSYNNAIYATIDPDTGTPLYDYTLTTPSGDISIQPDQLPVLGTVSFQ